MYKEKLQEIIEENFINDKIDFNKFINIYEKIDLISEDSAKKIFNETKMKAATRAIPYQLGQNIVANRVSYPAAFITSYNIAAKGGSEIAAVSLGTAFGLGVGLAAAYPFSRLVNINLKKGVYQCKARTNVIKDRKKRKIEYLKCISNQIDFSIQRLNQLKPKCKNEKNPEKCEKKFNKLFYEYNKIKIEINHKLKKLLLSNSNKLVKEDFKENIITSIPWVMAAKIIRNSNVGFDRCYKESRLIKTNKKENILKCKINVLNKSIIDLNKTKHICKNEKNPEKCNKKLNNLIISHNLMKEKYKKKLNELYDKQ